MENTTPSRNHYIDNLKAILIFLVVFAHLIETYIGLNIVVKYIYVTIYVFHMPFFVFWTGYLANKNVKYKKIGKYFLLYLVLQAIVAVFRTFISGAFQFDWLITPYWIFWYLLSYVCWLLLLKAIKNVKLLYVILAFFVALIVGFVPFIGKIMSLSRTITLFPFFLLGTYLKQHPLAYDKIKSKLKFILPFLTVLVLVIISTQVVNIDVVNLYFKTPYSDNFQILSRAVVFLFSIILSLQIALVVSNKKTIFTSFGEKTLSIYLLHIIIVGLFRLIPTTLNPYLIIITSFILAFGICFLFSRRQFNIQTLFK